MIVRLQELKLILQLYVTLPINSFSFLGVRFDFHTCTCCMYMYVHVLVCAWTKS